MNNQFLCDVFRNDYEQYLKQSILFSKNVNAVYYDPLCDRQTDVAFMEERFRILQKYEDFDNVTLSPIQGKPERLFEFAKNPALFRAICDELQLSDIERQCFFEYQKQEFDYQVFMDRHPSHYFCGYMMKVYNIAVEYTGMMQAFCNEYQSNQGNIISNSNLLLSLLSSDAVQKEQEAGAIESDQLQISTIGHDAFRSRYCEICRKDTAERKEALNTIAANGKAIEILLPDFTFLEAEDLYEVRLKAAPEIERLADYLDSLSVTADDEDELERLLGRKINPAIEDLKLKVKGMRWSVLKNALSIKDFAVIPIVAKYLSHLPGYAQAGLSALLIAADIGIEIKKEVLELKQDPMYFTMKLNKVVKKQAQKRNKENKKLLSSEAKKLTEE